MKYINVTHLSGAQTEQFVALHVKKFRDRVFIHVVHPHTEIGVTTNDRDYTSTDPMVKYILIKEEKLEEAYETMMEWYDDFVHDLSNPATLVVDVDMKEIIELLEEDFGIYETEVEK